MKKILKRFVVAILGAVGLFVIIDAAYFWQQILYYTHKPAMAPVQTLVKIQGQKMQPDLLIIPALGVIAPVRYVALNSETIFQQALDSGVVHYPGTAGVGQSGNCYIFGHSSDFWWSKGKYKTVFALLPHLKKNDIIILSNPQGDAFVYTVTGSKVISSTDIQYLNQNDKTKKLLTLQTSYPVGTALERFIVLAEIK